MNASGAAERRAATQAAAARRRSIARLAAVQALYQLELNPGRGPDAVIGEFLHHRLGREIDGDNYGEADEKLFAEIVRGVAEHRERLDETLSAALSEEWPLPRLETLLRLILEAGRLRAGAPARHPAAGHDQRICRDRLCVLQRPRAGAGERRLRPPRAHAAGGGVS